jgi:hypothetical protein
MDAERWRRISAVFDQLCEAPVSERDALLERYCGGDSELHREVAALLVADAAGGALDQHVPKLRIAVAADWARDSEAPAPTSAAGGCGVNWAAAAWAWSCWQNGSTVSSSNGSP